MEKESEFMKKAAEEALLGMKIKDGGPFGAVIVKDGQILVAAHNMVIKTNDPTAHAEVTAIRKAANLLGRFDLSDCEIYTSCEPCPMCFGAIHWAKIKKMYYGCTAKDAEDIGFDDKFIYDAIKGTADKKQLDVTQVGRDFCMEAFEEWKCLEAKTQY